MSEWKETTTEEIIYPKKGSLISGPFGSNISSKYFVSAGVPVIRGNNLSLDLGMRFNDKDFVFVTQEKAEELNTWAEKDDIIFTAAGTIGQVGIIEDTTYERYIISNKQIRLRIDKSKAIPRYVYYWFASSQMREKIISMDTGSTIPLINLGVVRSLPLLLPPVSTQSAIVGVISSLDDKIDLLTRQNATLEALALTYFRQWFLAEKHKEFEYGKAENYFDIAIGKTPPRHEQEWFSENPTDNVWVSISDMGKAGLFIGESLEYLTDEAISKFNIRRIPKGSILLSFKLTVGRVSIALCEMTTNEAIAHFKCKEERQREYLYCYLKLYDYYSLGSTSSIATAVNSKIIKEMPFIMPDINRLNDFHELTFPMFKKMESNAKQILTLQKLRDTLLPKLISGEVKLKQ